MEGFPREDGALDSIAPRAGVEPALGGELRYPLSAILRGN